jgi:hypothetical protein
VATLLIPELIDCMLNGPRIVFDTIDTARAGEQRKAGEQAKRTSSNI